PDGILLKPGRLGAEEWKIMRTHPELGRRLVERIPFLRGAVPIVYHHHERWDGSGYPSGLKGEMIPLGARIFAVADAFHALTTGRTRWPCPSRPPVWRSSAAQARTSIPRWCKPFSPFLWSCWRPSGTAQPMALSRSRLPSPANTSPRGPIRAQLLRLSPRLASARAAAQLELRPRSAAGST